MMLDVSEQEDKWRVFYVSPVLAPAGTTYVEQWRKHFNCFNDMPRKTREGVACLSMCTNGEKIKGVGQRVSEKTYWLDSTQEVLDEYKTEEPVP